MDSVVKEICHRINNTVLNSGLHFIINQTPFSNYITIRKKFSRHPPTNLAAPDMEIKSDVRQNLDSFKDTAEEIAEQSNQELTGTVDSKRRRNQSFHG
jgi:hypothetical protein